MAKQALLVIDVQRGLFDAAPRPGDADAVLARERFVAMALAAFALLSLGAALTTSNWPRISRIARIDPRNP